MGFSLSFAMLMAGNAFSIRGILRMSDEEKMKNNINCRQEEANLTWLRVSNGDE